MGRAREQIVPPQRASRLGEIALAVYMFAMPPFSYKWPVRCAKCRHTAEIDASAADLASKVLVCSCCGKRQAFAPEMIVRAPRRPNGRRARAARHVLATMAPGELDDPIADLWAAG